MGHQQGNETSESKMGHQQRNEPSETISFRK
jgi:hypothetical protein